MAEVCGEESPVERVLIRCRWQEHDVRGSKGCCHIHKAGDSGSSVFHCRVFDPSLSQSEQVVEEGSHDYLEGSKWRVCVMRVCVFCSQ